jgi:hypothetical protein
MTGADLRMPDILLIQPPIQDFYLTAKRTMPYGLACIAGALRQAGFSVAILDALATAKTRHGLAGRHGLPAALTTDAFRPQSLRPVSHLSPLWATVCSTSPVRRALRAPF